MLTSKPFSTISYNSVDYLETKLDDLITRRKIVFYAFVKHLKEEDEKKDHIHLYIEPDGRVETNQLTDYLLEPDVKHPDKPLGVTVWRSSKFGDWYLYATHNKQYLLSKGQQRAHFYALNDFKTSNSDVLEDLVHRIDMSKINRLTVVQKAAENGVAFEQLVADGQIPIQLINQYQTAYTTLLHFHHPGVERNDRKTHTPRLSKTSKDEDEDFI